MRSKRKKSWPSGFYSDGLSYRMKTADGRFRRLGSNEARALRKFHQVRRLETGGDSVGAPASARMTLRTVAERWLEAQQADGVRDADRDFGRFKNHVDPLIGSRRIGDIEARDLMLMIRELKRQKRARWISASRRWVDREYPRCLLERVRACDPRRRDRAQPGEAHSEPKTPEKAREGRHPVPAPRGRRVDDRCANSRGPKDAEHAAGAHRHAHRRSVWTSLARLRPGDAGARCPPRVEPVRRPAAQDGSRRPREGTLCPRAPRAGQGACRMAPGRLCRGLRQAAERRRLHRTGPRNHGRENAEQSGQEPPGGRRSCSASMCPAGSPTACAAGSSRRAATPPRVRRWSS